VKAHSATYHACRIGALFAPPAIALKKLKNTGQILGGNNSGFYGKKIDH